MRLATLLSAAALHAVTCSATEPESFFVSATASCPDGAPAVRMLAPQAANEVAVAGAIGIRATVAEFLDRFRDIKTFKRSAEVAAIGFVRELPFPEQQAIQAKSARFQRSLAAREIASSAEFLREYAPPLISVLNGSPKEPAVEQFTYWSREKLLSKPVLTVTEASIFHDRSNKRAFILTRQVFAEAHFEASLGITALFETPRGVCLVYLNRSRSAFFSGPLGGMRKSVARAFLLPVMERKLLETRSRFEPIAAVR